MTLERHWIGTGEMDGPEGASSSPIPSHFDGRPLGPIAAPRDTGTESVDRPRRGPQSAESGTWHDEGAVVGGQFGEAGAVLALKELLDFDDGKELPLLVAGPSLVEPLDHEAAASMLVQDLLLGFRVRLPRGNTGS